MKSIYYLFGSEVCRVFVETDDINKVIETAKNEVCAVFQFVEGVTSPSTLLAAYNGYNDYMEITKDEFITLQNNGVRFAKDI